MIYVLDRWWENIRKTLQGWRKQQKSEEEIYNEIDQAFNNSRKFYCFGWGIGDGFRAYLIYLATGDIASASVFMAIASASMMLVLVWLPFFPNLYARPLLQHEMALWITFLITPMMCLMLLNGGHPVLYWSAALLLGINLALDTTSLQQHYMQKRDHSHAAEQIGALRSQSYAALGLGLGVGAGIFFGMRELFPQVPELTLLACLYLVVLPCIIPAIRASAKARTLKRVYADVTKPGEMDVHFSAPWKRVIKAIGDKNWNFVLGSALLVITQAGVAILLINVFVYMGISDAQIWLIALLSIVLHVSNIGVTPIVKLERRVSRKLLIALSLVIAGCGYMGIVMLPMILVPLNASLGFVGLVAAQSLAYGVSAQHIPAEYAASVSWLQSLLFRLGGMMGIGLVALLLQDFSLDFLLWSIGVILIGVALMSLILLESDREDPLSYSAVQRIMSAVHLSRTKPESRKYHTP